MQRTGKEKARKRQGTCGKGKEKARKRQGK